MPAKDATMSSRTELGTGHVDQVLPGNPVRAALELSAKALTLFVAVGVIALSVSRLTPALNRYFTVRSGMIEVEALKLRTLDQVATRPIRSGDQNRSVGHVRTGVVLVFNSKCMVCSLNMVNWLRLNHELHRALPDARIAALTIESDSLALDYFSPFDAFELEHWQLREPGVGKFKEVLGVQGVPATLVVRNDSIVAAFMGVMGPLRRQAVVRLVKEGPAR
jgi:hypothetical protein